MESNEDDDLMRRYLFLEQEMAELRQALRDKKAVNEQDRHWEDEIVVVSDEEEDGEPKSLDVIGMRKRGFDVKTLERDESDVYFQTALRCPQPNCVCLFKYPSDLVEHRANVHQAEEACQFEASSQNSASFSQLQDNLRITYTASDGQSEDEEVFEIIVMSDDKKDNAPNCDGEEAQLEQENSKLNQESIAIIKMEEDEEVEEADKTEETGGADETIGQDLIGTQESEGDDVAMSKEDNENDSGDKNDDSATELEDSEFDPDADRRFQCRHPECARSFKNKKHLKDHQNLHTTRFQCQVCQMCFNSMHKLQQHQVVHSDDRPFVCDWTGCGGTFKWENQLKHHRKTVHSNERPYQCDKQGCSWSFKSKETLRHHLRFAHSSLRRFKCQVQGCDKRCKTRSEFKTHMNYVHYNVRKFRCHFKDCGKAYKGQQDLKNHMTVHSDELPFKCTENGCDAAFKTKGCLTRHIQTHTPDRPFQCPEEGCDKQYKSKGSLKEHVKSVHLRGN